MTGDPFKPLSETQSAQVAKHPRKPSRQVVVPVPPDAPPPPVEHPKLGKPVAIWAYRDANSGVAGYVHRYDTGDSKSFRPLVLFTDLSGKLEWRWASWPKPRPLYGLDRLAARPDAPVIVAEGEKSADAAG